MENLVAWLKTFARPMRGQQSRFIVDEFDSEFYLILNCENAEGSPPNTCHVMAVPLFSEDPLADGLPLVFDASADVVKRLLLVMGIERFNTKTQEALSVLYTAPPVL